MDAEVPNRERSAFELAMVTGGHSMEPLGEALTQRPRPNDTPRPAHRAATVEEIGLLRPVFNPGQLLSEDDLNALVAYVDSRIRRQALVVHGPGVVSGLAVSADTTHALVSVSAGAAIDPTGRLLELESPLDLQVEPAGVVVIRYTETLTHPVAGLAEDPLFTRAEESAMALFVSTPDPNDVTIAVLEHGHVVSP